MSLSRAKKRLLGSLYRKKKLKISEQKDDEPNAFLRSISALPSNVAPMFANEDPIGQLQSSTSLPDQLDQSGTMAVSNISSKSLSCIDALDPNLQLREQHVRDYNSEYGCDNYADSTQNIPANKLCSSNMDSVAIDSCNIECCHSELQNDAPGLASEIKSMTDCSNHTPLMIGCSNDIQSNSSFPNDIQSTLICPNDNRSASVYSNVLKSGSDISNVSPLPNEPVQQKLLDLAIQHASKIQTTPDFLHNPDILTMDQYPGISNPQNFLLFDNNSHISSLYSDSEFIEKASCDSFNNNTDFDITSFMSIPEEGPDEVFHADQSFPSFSKTDKATSIQNTFMNNVLPTNQIHGDFAEKELTNEHTLDKDQNPPDDSYNKSEAICCHDNSLQNIDNSIINKIKFFETYSKIVKKNSFAKSGLNSIESRNGKKRAKSTMEDVRIPLTNNISESIIGATDCEDNVASCNKIVNPLQTVVNSRGFNRSAVLRQRLNFSRFKRSDSIPEVELACSCGEVCDEECNYPVVDVMIKTSDSREDVSGGCNDERISHSQVCHHPQCRDGNDDFPLMLCSECDHDIHENPMGSGHLVFDIKKNRDQFIAQKQNDDQTDSSPVPSVMSSNEATDLEAQTADDVIVNGQLSPRLAKKPREDSFAGMTSKDFIKKRNYNVEATTNGQASPVLKRTESVNSDLTAESSSSPGSFTGSDSSQPISSPGREPPTSEADTSSVPVGLVYPMIRKKLKNSGGSDSLTIRFCLHSSSDEDLVTVAATPNKRLWEALAPLLDGRQIDINSVNVFLERSQTPLPMESIIFYLTDKTLEVKEKDHKELDPSILGATSSTSIIPWSRKGSKITGRGSRRDSAGLASLLLDAPPTRQRRGSLQLHFRENIFTKTDTRIQENSKVYDDILGSLPGRRLGSSTPEDDPSWTYAGSSTSVKRSKSNKRPKGFDLTNKEKERKDQLKELLAKYSEQGLTVSQQFDESIFEMETSWKLIVGNHENMTKRQHEQQEAVWELLHTEVSYIKQIRFIIDVFQNCLKSVQQESYLNGIESERLFSNIDKVFECNCLFWQRHFLPLLQQTRETGKPLDPVMFKEAFVVDFPVLFQVYFRYLIEHKSCLDYAKMCMDNIELFKTFIHWAETQKQSNRLRMADILVQPMPRLLKYSLLLRAILKYTENDEDRVQLQEMIQSVDKLCDAINDHLRRRDEYTRLATLWNKFMEPFDSLEAPTDECSKIIQEHTGNFNLLAPIPDFRDGVRSLLFKSNLKMKEGQNAKMDVDCFLFTDLLLVCKFNRKIERYKILRPPMRLDQLVVSELKDKGSFLLIYVNEYSVPLSAFTFHSEAGAIRGWLDKFRQAQKEFKEMELYKNVTKTRSHSDTASTQGELEYMSMISPSTYLESASFVIPRSDSVNSLDHIRLSHLAARDASSNPGPSELARSSSLINFTNPPSSLTTQPNGPRTGSDLVMPLNVRHSSFNEYKTCNEPIQVNFQNRRTDIKMQQPSIITKTVNRSAPIGADLFISFPDDPHTYREAREKTKSGSFSNVLSDQFRNGSHSQSELAHFDQGRIGEDENDAKPRPNSRRSDKRYRTADEIPEIKSSQKESSIHKWSSLRMDVENADSDNFESIIFSTDSLQSYPSSSGVSSTGSLHFPMEMNEGVNDNIHDGVVLSDSCPTIVEHCKNFSVDDTGDLSGMDDVVDGDCKSCYPPVSKHSKSKSTSDLVEAFNNNLRISQVTDGIDSVNMSVDALHMKLTQRYILQMKKRKHQILSDANTESSDV